MMRGGFWTQEEVNTLIDKHANDILIAIQEPAKAWDKEKCCAVRLQLEAIKLTLTSYVILGPWLKIQAQ